MQSSRDGIEGPRPDTHEPGGGLGTNDGDGTERGTSPHDPLRSPRSAWARDFAIVGGASSFLAPFLVSSGQLGAATLLGTTVAGAVSGAALGALLQRPLSGPLGRTPWPLLALLCAAVGACWGAVVGFVGATVMAAELGVITRGADLREVYAVFMVCASTAAAGQLGWFGVSYARGSRAGGATWPLVLGAVGTPFLGWAALRLLVVGLIDWGWADIGLR